ncbi:MAG: excinuclease ABC subunit UvrB [Patescibacteria group bacterium]
MSLFNLKETYEPAGDQPEAIAQLAQGLKEGLRDQVLLGVTGSGKTFTMAHVIQKCNRPTLIISHNKTLAAQLYREFKTFFPDNAVHYFVSYFDYYQPEAYLPTTDTYIEKDSKINEEIDRLRHAATQAIMSRDDVIVIASVSCIYNLGSPEDYKKMGLELFTKKKMTPSDLARNLMRLQYAQDIELKRGTFRKTRDEIEIISPSAQEITRVTFSGTTIVNIERAIIPDADELATLTPAYEPIEEITIFPAKYWIADDSKNGIAIENIKSELQKHVKVLKAQDKHLEAGRLHERTLHDMEMIRQTGYCHGIENYSAHLDFRKPGAPPYTLLDFFAQKGEFLTIIDESHISVPQLRSMYAGDHARKTTLVNYGFRLPSAIDNRPLMFVEFAKRIQKTVYVSATPSEYELKKAKKKGIAEQLVRPTGLLDPTVEIHPSEGQINHLLERIRERVARNERVIVTTLTKRMAEDLAEFLARNDVKVNYLHSEIKTLDRLQILKEFRLGTYDVIVGVNLLREGLDLPEVSLVAILDADKEGFLRNTTTMIQTMGRAARHVQGHVILYADKETKSILAAVGETQRRRARQEIYNTERGIIPQSVQKHIGGFDLPVSRAPTEAPKPTIAQLASSGSQGAVAQLTKMMERAIRKMDYETAMSIRDQIQKIKHRDNADT